MVSFEFDRDVAVEAAGPGRWRGTVSPRWNIGSAPNGGYLVSIGLSALSASLSQPDPFAVSAHFPGRIEPGPVEVEVEVVREGRAHSVAAAKLIQDGQARVHVTATYGDLSSLTGPTVVRDPPPTFPPPEGCVRAEGPVAPEMMRRFDLRLVPETAMFAVGQPSGVADMAGWIRFVDGREPDSGTLPLFCDALPPTVINLMRAAWVPTIELTVHVRARPQPGWLQGRFQTRYLMEGYLEEDGEMWDQNGRLVAMSRQLARIHEEPGQPG